jgi:hypothetical protein
MMMMAPLLLAGCFLGADPLPPSAHDDAQPVVPVPDAAPPPPDAPPPPTCKNATNTIADGHHNPGLDCMAGNCHGPASQDPTAPRWTVAGTLYEKLPTGPKILPYATITITDATGVKLDLVSSLNGNFYSDRTLTYPITVYASECPALQPMTEQVQNGSCNACHLNGSKQGVIYLPPPPAQ